MAPQSDYTAITCIYLHYMYNSIMYFSFFLLLSEHEADMRQLADDDVRGFFVQTKDVTDL